MVHVSELNWKLNLKLADASCQEDVISQYKNLLKIEKWEEAQIASYLNSQSFAKYDIISLWTKEDIPSR